MNSRFNVLLLLFHSLSFKPHSIQLPISIIHNCFMEILDKISVGMYLTGSIIARVIFYNPIIINESNNKMDINLLQVSLIAIRIFSVISSILLAALFKLPLIKIWFIVKHKSIEEKIIKIRLIKSCYLLYKLNIN